MSNTPENTKKCSRCKKVKKLDENFYKSKRNKDGLDYVCKECCCEKSSKHYRENPEYYQAREAKKRDKSKSLIYDYTAADWRFAVDYFDKNCAYCNRQNHKLHRDHFYPLSKGGHYIPRNIIPACRDCNLSKNNKKFMEWYIFQPFYNKDNIQKIFEFFMYVRNVDLVKKENNSDN